MKEFHSVVEEIHWDRIYLVFKVKCDVTTQCNLKNLKCYLLNSEHQVELKFEVLPIENNTLRIKANITNTGINRCIVNGTYRLFITDDSSCYSVALYESKSSALTGVSRCFRYNNNRGAYTITFSIDEYSETPVFLIQIVNLKQEKLANIPPLSKDRQSIKVNFVNRLIRKVKNIVFAIFGTPQKNKRRIIRWIYNVSKALVRSNKQRVLFLSFQQNDLALNMRELYKRMLDRGLDKELIISFSLRKATSEHQTLLSKFRTAWLIGCSDTIVVDDHVPWFDWLVLDTKKNKLIQIWHAGAGFKGVGFSRWGHFGCPGPFNCHRQYAYCITDSSKIAHFFSEQFGILEEQVIPTGMPRLDSFLNPIYRQNTVAKIFSTYPEILNKKVILFAPTYRGQNRATAYYPYEIINFELLYHYCVEKNAVVIFKMHPWVKSNDFIPSEYKDRIFDWSGYQNINDIFYITDILITDYSSGMYEYALMNKPMLAFAFDKEQYSNSRGFHRDYNKNVPGKVCSSFTELMEALENDDFEFYKHTLYLKNHFDSPDQNNSDRVIDWLILDGLPEVYKKCLSDRLKEVESYRGKSYEHLFQSNISLCEG